MSCRNCGRFLSAAGSLKTILDKHSMNDADFRELFEKHIPKKEISKEQWLENLDLVLDTFDQILLQIDYKQSAELLLTLHYYVKKGDTGLKKFIRYFNAHGKVPSIEELATRKTPLGEWDMRPNQLEIARIELEKAAKKIQFVDNHDVSYTIAPLCCKNTLLCRPDSIAPIETCQAFHDFFLSIPGREEPIDIENINKEAFRFYTFQGHMLLYYTRELLGNPKIGFGYIVAKNDGKQWTVEITKYEKHKHKHRYSIYMLSVQRVGKVGHANLVVVDNQHGCLYHFEPNGNIDSNGNNDSTEVQEVGNAVLKEFPQNYRISFLTDFRPQHSDYYSSEEYHYDFKLEGTCVLWSLMFLVYTAIHVDHPYFAVQDEPIKLCYVMFASSIINENSHGITMTFANVMMAGVIKELNIDLSDYQNDGNKVDWLKSKIDYLALVKKLFNYGNIRQQQVEGRKFVTRK